MFFILEKSPPYKKCGQNIIFLQSLFCGKRLRFVCSCGRLRLHQHGQEEASITAPYHTEQPLFHWHTCTGAGMLVRIRLSVSWGHCEFTYAHQEMTLKTTKLSSSWSQLTWWITWCLSSQRTAAAVVMFSGKALFLYHFFKEIELGATLIWRCYNFETETI